ncbi:MAG: histone deacetylase family protein [bacterium]
MKVIFSEQTKLHNPTKEFISNTLIEYAETPDRMNTILESLKWMNDINIIQPEVFDIKHILKVHSAQYIEFLHKAYDNWVSAGLNAEGVMPDFFAVGNIRKRLITKSPIGQAGYYMTDLSTMIVEGSYIASLYSAYSALTAAKCILEGDKAVFSLSRPPGHHAGYEFAGGYCFMNNAAIAARYLQDNCLGFGKTRAKICILDVDYHHGNGTQDIIQRQENMLFVSIHGNPDYAYPYLTGFTEENGEKVLNYPLTGHICNREYFEVLSRAVDKIKSFNPEYFIVCFGVDTHESERAELGDFRLTTEFYKEMAEHLSAELDIPTLLILEGGFKISVLGANVCSFLGPYTRH